MGTTEKVAITVAVIGLTGTLGAALISSGAFRQTPDKPPEANQSEPDDQKLTNAAVAAEDTTRFAPHAKPIQVNQSTAVWGEQTKLIELGPGKKIELDGRDLYSEATTYPQSSCSGPGYIVYTWQVRQPYPEGGDLEIRWVIPQGGGNTEQIAMGAMGRGRMDPCNIHVFINRGLEPMKLELRYATAMDQEPMAQVDVPEAVEQ